MSTMEEYHGTNCYVLLHPVDVGTLCDGRDSALYEPAHCDLSSCSLIVFHDTHKVGIGEEHRVALTCIAKKL